MITIKFKAIFTLFLFLFVEINYGRTVPADYWKSVMKEQPMPQAIRDALVEHPNKAPQTGSRDKEIKHFVKEFDTRTIAVIYRKLRDPKEIISEKKKIHHKSKKA